MFNKVTEYTKEIEKLKAEGWYNGMYCGMKTRLRPATREEQQKYGIKTIKVAYKEFSSALVEDYNENDKKHKNVKTFIDSHGEKWTKTKEG